MDAPQPSAPDSLTMRAAASLRAGWARLRLRDARDAPPPGRGDWIVAAGIAGLIAAGPLVTIAGAKLLAASARAEAGVLAVQAAPRVAARDAVRRDRLRLTALTGRATIGGTIEALARSLPPETAVIAATRGTDGLLSVEVSAQDPDALRAALRREPALAGLRDTGQRQGDMTMLVTLKETAP